MKGRMGEMTKGKMRRGMAGRRKNGQKGLMGGDGGMLKNVAMLKKIPLKINQSK